MEVINQCENDKCNKPDVVSDSSEIELCQKIDSLSLPQSESSKMLNGVNNEVHVSDSIQDVNCEYKQSTDPLRSESVIVTPSMSDNFVSEVLDKNLVNMNSAETVMSVCNTAVQHVNETISSVQRNSANINSGETIMSVCSTAAQHIKETISSVLNSREQNSDPALSDTSSNIFETSLKEKIADFENAVMCNFSEEKDSYEMANNVDCHILTDTVEHQSSELNSVLEDIANKPVETEEQLNLADGDSLQQAESKESNGEEASLNNEVCIQANASSDEKPMRKAQKGNSNKKKGEKTIDQILKSLSEFPTAEEKLQVLCKKHSETLEDLRTYELRCKHNERQVIQLAREKEQLQAEHNRMILAKSRLEGLCRELQRQNKAVKEESLLRIREEEEKRKDVASKFQTTLTEISTLMQENSKKNVQLKEENGELAQKLKSLVEHYEMWEKHMEKVVQQKDLEAQLGKAKFAKANLQLKEETEKYLREKQGLLENLNELQKKCTMLATNELQLRTELSDYTSKYEEFQAVLDKSNQVFADFKINMEMTSKKIKKLEKETNVWKKKWENSNNALLEMVTDKQKRDKELLNAQQRILTLEKLCRALQSERNDLQNKVKGLSASGSSSSYFLPENEEATATVTDKF